jgi:hypothetical protein
MPGAIFIKITLTPGHASTDLLTGAPAGPGTGPRGSKAPGVEPGMFSSGSNGRIE